MLTHFYDDHAGSAADLASWAGAAIIAGSADSAFVRSVEPGPLPAFTAAEKRLPTPSPRI